MSATRRFKSDGSPYCYECKKNTRRKYYLEHGNASDMRTPESRRRYRLMGKYGMEPDDVEKLLQDQDEMCAICGTNNFGPHGPNVDHNHSTGAIRGILCMQCNIGLGAFKDEVIKLENAIKYLKKF